MDTLSLYSKIRKRMQNGDVVAFQGTDIPAKAIQKATQSQYSHVGLVVRIPDVSSDRIFVLESVPPPGVVLVPLSRKLLMHKGNAWWAPLQFSKVSSSMRLPVNEEQARAAIYKWAMLELGKPYDYKEIGSIIGKILLKAGAKKQDCWEYVCSELVAQAFLHAQIWPRGISAANVTPVDIMNLPIIGGQVKIWE